MASSFHTPDFNEPTSGLTKSQSTAACQVSSSSNYPFRRKTLAASVANTNFRLHTRLQLLLSRSDKDVNGAEGFESYFSRLPGKLLLVSLFSALRNYFRSEVEHDPITMMSV